MITILFFSIILSAYAIIFVITKGIIIEKIRNYKDYSIQKYEIIDEKLYCYLLENKEKLAIYGALGWPIYYLFGVGAACGADVFNTLIGDNYENRIATWLV